MVSEIQHSDKLNEYLIKAIAVHLGIVMLAVIFNTVLNLNLFQFEMKKREINVIQSAVRVDLVGLPKLTLQELKLIDLNRVVNKPEPVDNSKINETSKVEIKKLAKKIDISSLLNKYSSKKSKVKPSKRIKNKAIDTSLLKDLVLEGNKVSKGTSITGDEVTLGQKEFINYIQALPDRIRPNWKLPSYLTDKGLRCRVRVYLASNGSVLRVTIYESSGDAEYDSKALKAIKISSPLPKPVREILARVTSGDIILGFPL